MVTLTNQPHLTSNDAIQEYLDGCIICDAKKPGYPIINASKRFCQLTGFEHREIIGHSCAFLQGPDTDSNTIAEINKTLAAGSEFRGKILNYKKDGSAFWNYLKIDPIYENGSLIQFVGIQTDITDSERAHEEISLQQKKNTGFKCSHDRDVA